MMPPTIKNLRWLDAFDAARRPSTPAAEIIDPITILPKARLDETGKMIGVAMPWDTDYDDTLSWIGVGTQLSAGFGSVDGDLR